MAFIYFIEELIVVFNDVRLVLKVPLHILIPYILPYKIIEFKVRNKHILFLKL